MLDQPTSYAATREILRWRVALVLGVLMAALMVSLAVVNTRMGFDDTALLSMIVLGINLASVGALLLLPKRFGSGLFFATILGLVMFAVVFGWWHGRPLHYWGYLFPAVVVFLLPPWRAMAAMMAFGSATAAVVNSQLPAVEVVRFASVYGLMVCFVTTYALLEERAVRMLRELGDRDGLTGCLNRRRFNEAMARLDAPAAEPIPLGVMLADIDHFKAINDERGHLEGDRVLAAVSQALGLALQIESNAGRAWLYRYGGEEFAILVRGRDAIQLGLLAEALRSALAVGGPGLEPGEVSISIGVAAWRQGIEPPLAALQRADDALYAAKRAGRDRVQVAPPQSAKRRPTPASVSR